MSRYGTRNRWVKAAFKQGSQYLGFVPAAVVTAGKQAAKRDYRKAISYGMKSTKHKPKVRSNVRLTSDVKSCKQALKQLKMESDASLGTYHDRRIFSTQVNASFSTSGFTGIIGSNLAVINFVLATVPIFDEDTPGTLQEIDMTEGTYQRKILFPRSSTKCLIRNNYITDCHIKVWLCTPKADTQIAAGASWTAAAAAGGALSTDLLQSPNDYSDFRKIWKAVLVKDIDLRARESCEVVHYAKSFQYDSSLAKLQTDLYQKRYGAHEFLIQLYGTPAHAAGTGANIGLMSAALDVITERKFKLEYDAGSNFTQYNIINDLESMTDPVQSVAPIADNLAKSTP